MKRKHLSKLKDCQVFFPNGCAHSYQSCYKIKCHLTLLSPSLLSQVLIYPKVVSIVVCRNLQRVRVSHVSEEVSAVFLQQQPKISDIFNAGGEIGSFSWLIFGLWSINSWPDRNNLPSFLGKVRTQLTTYLEKSKTFKGHRYSNLVFQ